MKKTKTQTTKTVPNKTLKNDHCRYSKETVHMMADCPKLAKRRKLEEDPDDENRQNCNTPGHEVENCYFGANMENRPPKWTLTKAQKKVIENYRQAKKTNKTKNRTTTTILFQGFKLETHALIQNLHRNKTQQMTGSINLTQNLQKPTICETKSTTQNSQQSTLETQPEDLYELLHDVPDNYFPQEPTHPETDSNSVIQHTTKHHVTKRKSCND